MSYISDPSGSGMIPAALPDNWATAMNQTIYRTGSFNMADGDKITDTGGSYSLINGESGNLAFKADIGNATADSNIGFSIDGSEKVKLITFEGEQEKFKEKTQKHVTKSKYIRKISNIKNEKIKKSLIGLSKLFKKK